MSPRVDLHMHSTASDGEFEPEALAGLCADAGLAAVALTDHNSLRNVPRMGEACADRGIDVIPACEISTVWHEREHHCLAYFLPLDDPVLNDRLERVRRADLERSRRWVELAAQDGVPVSWEQVEEAVGADRVPPFSYLARLLVESGDERLAGHRERSGGLWPAFFAAGKPWSTEPPWQPSLPEAIAWVREAGGVPVLAHPGASLPSGLDPETALAELRDAGLAGVEAWTTWHKPETSRRFEALARANGLAVTAGADFHGPVVKPFVKAPGQVDENGIERLRELEDAREAVAG